MTKEQQERFDAILREGRLDLRADAQTLRAAFDETMKYVPIADDVERSPTTIGGVRRRLNYFRVAERIDNDCRYLIRAVTTRLASGLHCAR
jgi:hypothetical protein